MRWLDDEWTVITADMSLSAHYENTIVITEGLPEILTLTESEIAADENLKQYLGARGR